MTAQTTRPGKAVHIALWTLQLGLFLFFGFAGFLKTTTPLSQLHQMMAWTTATPDALVRFIGISELAGALGVLIPSITRIQPKLTPLAALGLATIMLLATAFHIMRGEWFALPITLGAAAAAGLVAWGRSRKAPIAPRRGGGDVPATVVQRAP